MNKGLGWFVMLGTGAALAVPAALAGDWGSVAGIMAIAALLATWA